MRPWELWVTVLVCGCATDHSSTPTQPQTPSLPKEEVGRTLIVVGRDDVRGSLPGPCQSFVYDYTGLYPIVDTLPGITEDSIYIDTLLKEAGMKVIDYGWGNWQDGPRMINMKLALETCTCTVTKLYLFHDELPDGYWNSRIIERVVCNVPDSLVPRWTDDKHMQAHRFSSHHRAQVLASDSCGCFHCKRIFTSREVSEWVDPDESGLGQTALCPYCGIDAVIYRISGYPFDKEFLTRMNRHWF